MSDTKPSGSYRYCEQCDQETAEWSDGPEGTDTCPSCGGVLYESEEAYISEMIRWLGDRFEWPEEDVHQFLADHGNPGKGQALAIISTKERREGRYRGTGRSQGGER